MAGPKHAIGIRVKLLSFYAAAILSVALLVLSFQVVTYGAVKEFESRLSRYHAIHRLSMDLSVYHSRMDQMLRDGMAPDEEVLDREIQDFLFSFEILEGSQAESLNAFFNLQAAHRGADAYFVHLGEAVRRRASMDKDWYLDMSVADKISSYMDAYFAILLSEALKAGADRYQTLTARIRSVRIMSFAGLGLFALFFGVGALIFSGSIAFPITRLAAASERIAEGDLDVPEVEASTGDEVEILARSFNTMSRSIKTMVQDLRGKADLEHMLRQEERELMEKEKALREAQFNSLQDQIRPHFLFNALNTIARTALFEGASETERLALALGKMFRYSMSSPESMVPLREEVSVVEEYLQFQRLRFGERLHWTIDSQKAAMDIPIPRFTLQPFVENAVRHGIEPLEKGGSVEIRVHKKSGKLYVSVRDTGKGTEELSEGVGISNVRKRLELRYGSDARLSVKSSAQSGTLVRLSFPISTPSEGVV